MHLKFTINKQRLQDEATRRMEIHSNPVTITFNITQIAIGSNPNDKWIQRRKKHERKNKLQRNYWIFSLVSITLLSNHCHISLDFTRYLKLLLRRQTPSYNAYSPLKNFGSETRKWAYLHLFRSFPLCLYQILLKENLIFSLHSNFNAFCNTDWRIIT